MYVYFNCFLIESLIYNSSAGNALTKYKIITNTAIYYSCSQSIWQFVCGKMPCSKGKSPPGASYPELKGASFPMAAIFVSAWNLTFLYYHSHSCHIYAYNIHNSVMLSCCMGSHDIRELTNGRFVQPYVIRSVAKHKSSQYSHTCRYQIRSLVYDCPLDGDTRVKHEINLIVTA